MILIGCAGAQKADNANDLLSKNMDDFLIWLVKNNNFSGSVLLMKDGKEILKRGYGFADRENKTLYTAQTISTVGSVTKPFTASAMQEFKNLNELPHKNYCSN